MAQAEGGDVLLKDGLSGGEVEPAASHVFVGQGDLDGEAPLGRAHVEHALVLLPGEPGGDGLGRGPAPGGHGLEVAASPIGVLVEAPEVALGVGLRFPGSQGTG